MNLAVTAIVAGYLALIWQFGLVGLLAAAAHICVMLLFVKR